MAKPKTFRSRATELDTYDLKRDLRRFENDVRIAGERVMKDMTQALLDHLKQLDRQGFEGLSVRTRVYKGRVVVYVDGKNPKTNVNTFALLDGGTRRRYVVKPFRFQSYQPRSGITGKYSSQGRGSKKKTIRDVIPATFTYKVAPSKGFAELDITNVKSTGRFKAKTLEMNTATSYAVRTGKSSQGGPRWVYIGPYIVTKGKDGKVRRRRRVHPGQAPRNYYEDIAKNAAKAVGELIEKTAELRGFTVDAGKLNMVIKMTRNAGGEGAVSQRRWKVE